MSCKKKRIGDQWQCYDCRLTWDTNDTDPPRCKTLSNTDFAEVMALAMTDNPKLERSQKWKRKKGRR